MQKAREALTPDALALLQAVAQAGSFASAARELGLVPSAVTYRIRQIEDALDVLLFDRSSRQARLTDAGIELLREGGRLLQEMDAVANRVKRVATGWESQLTIAVDTVISCSTMMELVQTFFGLAPTTRVRLRDESLSGTLEAVTTGGADLAIGIPVEPGNALGVQTAVLGELPFVLCVAPHHPLAAMSDPLSDELLLKHRAIAVADSVKQGTAVTFGLLAGQDVLTVPTMAAKLDAQLRGLGVGFVPEPMARAHVERGTLVVKQVVRSERIPRMSYAWRTTPPPGRGLQWWLRQLESPATRRALLERHAHA
ncbi:LysR family transcriptional regulator [Caenimonas koreensis]|uniref:LysR family transcriptional regulator n=1 Tax=Caenimonas koreensis DSM 17982 TaxID=1121255 RepID=A0A844ASV6_9BURK|nr:LysR family transcriptional regulator [Caenimonas koreensis]MRD47415.1 LysR family transcriptional regulator [Caenimonas koreensis DSM 17982]